MKRLSVAMAALLLSTSGSVLKVAEMGAPINARKGLNTWAAFVGTNEKAAVAGDVAMLANEVQLASAHLAACSLGFREKRSIGEDDDGRRGLNVLSDFLRRRL